MMPKMLMLDFGCSGLHTVTAMSDVLAMRQERAWHKMLLLVTDLGGGSRLWLALNHIVTDSDIAELDMCRLC